jgi:hypothetical protein
MIRLVYLCYHYQNICWLIFLKLDFLNKLQTLFNPSKSDLWENQVFKPPSISPVYVCTHGKSYSWKEDEITSYTIHHLSDSSDYFAQVMSKNHNGSVVEHTFMADLFNV